METRSFQLSVFRFDPEKDSEARFQEFEVTMPEGLTVLQALMKIQDEQDGTLALRYACRGAVCGSCAMAVNGSLTLACRTSLSLFPSGSITVEPLPNLEIVKDLLVDMDPFWRAYEKVQPWLHTLEALPEREQRVSEGDRKKIDQFVNCILCACCYGACPVLGRDPGYLGPAAIAKLYRFVGDVRDVRTMESLGVADSEHGVWGCDTVFRCIEQCPKEVRPYDGIGGMRRVLVGRRLLGRGGKRA